MRRIRWGDVVVSGVAATGWALVTMAAVAALGLRLLGADAAGGSLGAMTAAVVVLAIGGTVTPSGDVSVLGITGPGAQSSLDVMPLGVGLAGALVLARIFLRSIRTGAPRGELAARAASVAVLLVAAAGGLARAGRDVVTLDGARLPGTPPAKVVPGIGDLGGLLPDRVGDLVETRARVGFSVESGPTLLGAGVWVLAVLAVALLASRRGPAAFARLRPAVSALVTALLLAVAAGLGAAVWAAAGDEHPGRVLGAALLGAPNGAWTGVLLGLLVPFDGRATGTPGRLLPDPLDDLLGAPAPVTVSRLAEYDGRIWLLVAGAGLLLLCAGVLAAVRTPGRAVAACAARLSAATGVALAVLALLTGVSVDGSLSVLGADAVHAGVELRGDALYALLLGAAWGAAAGGAGALLAGRRRPAEPVPRPAGGGGAAGPAPQAPTAAYGPPSGRPSPYALPEPGLGPGPEPCAEPDGSWDVTVTRLPRRPAGRPAPRHRPPFTPPPPPPPPPPLGPPG
ncbi:streptophobe family protein [Streptomyces flavotricini]|uniref:Streptophobe family protein n=1 Tax=Streptomyces flavotricini TaxID=66888 RepID=A0ABS8ED13_9ACTN|nr:streptophobe family protein [Streptomyces flavotricini]MCC0098910.1 streptophobe family protein [Streptomyces flavotricini]